MSKYLARLSDVLTVGACGVCVLLLTVNVRLHKQNDYLAKQIQVFEAGNAPPLGAHITSIRGKSVEGVPITLDLGHRQGATLLFITSPLCQFCAKTLPTWKTMTSEIGSDNVVYADTSGSLDESYLRNNNLQDVHNVVRINTVEGMLHGLPGTPTTCLHDKTGAEQASWAGLMDNTKVREFERAFTVNAQGK